MSEIKEKLINALRWVGAVVLPIPSGLIVSMLIGFISNQGQRRMGLDPDAPGLIMSALRFFDAMIAFGFGGFAISFVIYHLIPKHKMIASVVLVTIYSTLLISCSLISIFHGQPIRLVGSAIAIVVGIVFGLVHCKNSDLLNSRSNPPDYIS